MSEKAFRISVVVLLSAILTAQIWAALNAPTRAPIAQDLVSAGKDPKAREAVLRRAPVVLLEGSLYAIPVSGTVDVESVLDTVDVRVQR